MGNIGDSMSQTIPAVGSSGTQYATDIDAFLTEVKARLIAKVPRASLAAGALDLVNNALQNAQYVSLYTQSGVPTTPTGSLQTYGGNLYWVTATGQVQVTAGNALNVSGVNGITGDYGGVNPAQFRFVDADQEYYAYDDYAGGAWARLWAKNFDLAAGATSANRVRMAYGGAGSYTMTMPPSLPASIKPLVMDTAGAITTTGVIAAFSLGDFQRGFSATGGTGAITFSFSGSNNWQADVTAASTAYFHFDGFMAGDRIKKITWLESDAGTASTYTAFIGGSSRAATLTTTVLENTLTLNAAYTLTSAVPNASYGDPYIILRVVAGTGVASIVSGFMITYDRP